MSRNVLRLGRWYTPDYFQFWAKDRVSAEDLLLANQPTQIHKVRVTLFKKYIDLVGGIYEGKLISMDFNVDASSAVRRTCTLKFAMNLDEDNTYRDIGMYNQIFLEEGVLNLETNTYKWYSKGHFIVSNYSFSVTATERIVSLSLTDFMSIINGERDGTIKGYNPSIEVIEYNDFYKEKMNEYEGIVATTDDESERAEYESKINQLIADYRIEIPIDEAMTDITQQFYNQSSYAWAWEFVPVTNDKGVAEISGGTYYRDSDSQYIIPHDINFDTGVTLYEVLDKLNNLYPAYDLFFDLNHILRNMRKPSEEVTINKSATFMTAEDFNGLVISEEVNRDLKQIWNSCTVYGKDGIYKGSAEEFGGFSIYDPKRYGLVHKEFSGDVYDSLTSDGECQDWASYLLSQNLISHDTITVTLKNCAFFNDVNYKVQYPSKFNMSESAFMEQYYANSDQARVSNVTCLITGISSSFEDGTTTLTLARINLRTNDKQNITLDTPVITSCVCEGLQLDITLTNVQYAESYSVFCDGKKICASTSTNISYTFTAEDVGQHAIYIIAYSERFYNSNPSEEEVIEVTTNAILDNNGTTILDNNGISILDNN